MADVDVAPLPSTEALPATAPIPSNDPPATSKSVDTKASTTAALTPPASEESNKDHGSPASELSDVNLSDNAEDDDEEDIFPDHYYEGGRIPVFKPTMDQFRSFKKFVNKIDKYGMKSGIVKVIPPKEWRDSLPALDEAVKTIKVKNPITQEFSGIHGTYTQANIEKQRAYNLPQWKALTDESQHQPPAKRGERRKNQDKPPRPASTRTPAAPKPAAIAPSNEPGKRRPGRPRKSTRSRRSDTTAQAEVKEEEQEEQAAMDQGGIEQEDKELDAPPTPSSPKTEPEEPLPSTEVAIPGGPAHRIKQAEAAKSRKKSPAPRGKGRQPKSVAERRKYNRAETTDYVDEAAFKDFDYRFYPAEDEFSAERCAELEALYWRTLTFAAPMYGADMPGSLFGESTTSWNVAKLENLLDVLGQKVPGVNTAYLYLGMWKATFAWHLEDVDLYSINYIHFGAPKQWYSISQEDARRFENAMRNVWPNDAKNCSQFLRHKTYLISPQLLQSQYGIKVNKLVHYEGEFVITFPYGYHSGYNLGYNCAESVNFATEQWLEFGRIAKKCDCEADSVWIDVSEIERKLRGEPTPEYYEETDDEDMDGADHLPSPPPSVTGKAGSRKRKRADTSKDKKKVKKIKIRVKSRSAEPCALCPNEMPSEPLLPTDNGRHAHQCCALYTPETYIVVDSGFEKVCNMSAIDKARLGLKCSYCRSKKGACFQCSSRKCTRAYHASCAGPAGVQVEFGPTAVYGEDGTEYAYEGFDFRCRFHRPKRSKAATAESLEASSLIRKYAKGLQPKEVVQAQFLNGDIFAGTVVENRPGERTVVLDILPEGDRIEVEWRWLLALDPIESQLPKPSPDAQRLPEHMTMRIPADRNAEFGPPQEGDAFNNPELLHKWAEFNTAPAPHNRNQEKINFESPNKLWYYLGKDSTDARPKYTEDLALPRHNSLSLPRAEPPPQSQNRIGNTSQSQKRAHGNNQPNSAHHQALNGAMAIPRHPHQTPAAREIPNGGTSSYKPKSDPRAGKVEFVLNSQATFESKYKEHSSDSSSFLPLPPKIGTNAGNSTFTNQQGSPVFLHSPYDPPRGDFHGSMYQTGPTTTANSTHAPDDSENLQPHAAALLALAGPSTSHRPIMSSAGRSTAQEHAQLIAKFPYLRQSFCRREVQYLSPYPGNDGFSQTYTTFLPQSRPELHKRAPSTENFVESTVATPDPFASNPKSAAQGLEAERTKQEENSLSTFDQTTTDASSLQLPPVAQNPLIHSSSLAATKPEPPVEPLPSVSEILGPEHGHDSLQKAVSYSAAAPLAPM